ncbi:MAG: hypothetical protein WKF97_16980 [Chitinophagaceae bacterium]
MNSKVLFLALSVVALSSCSTAYKMGQTPDDVYFSPSREQDEYVAAEDQEDRYYSPRTNSSPNRYEVYDDYNNFRNDRFLRMSIGNRYRGSIYDDFYWNDGLYGSNNWKYNNYGNNWNSPWNSYYYWNNFYNPYNRFNYYSPYNGYSSPYNGYNNNGLIVVNPKAPVFNSSRPRLFNPVSYSNSYNNNNRYIDRNAVINSRPATNNTGSRYNNRNGFSNGVRRVISSLNNDSYYNNSNNNRSGSSNNNSFTPSRSSSSDAPVRTYTPSSSSSSSSGSSSSGGGGVSRPTRGGN